MSTSRRLARWMASFLAVFLLSGVVAPPGRAQASSDRVIEGVAIDQDEAALPGVSVSITPGCTCDQCDDPETCKCCPNEGVQRVVTTDAEGRFRVKDLPPGEYEVTASLEGFATVSSQADLSTQQVATVRIVFQTGTETGIE